MTQTISVNTKALDEESANYESLFKTWYEPLCRYAFSILRDMDESEDAVQKVFFKLWDSRNEVEIHSSMKSYLYRAVHNTCLNRIKQIKTRTEHNEQVAYKEDSVNNDVFENIVGNELGQEISKALNQLPPKCREVFRLSRVKMLSYSEISEELNISTNTIENHISKALKLLRVSLRDFLPIVTFLYITKICGLW